MIHAVVFDLDDTLFPERDFAFSGHNAVATAFADRLGDAATTAARMRQLYDTQHRGRVFNVLCAERGMAGDDGLIAAMIEVYRTHRPSIALHADADAALRRLAGGYRLGLISDGPLAMQEAKVAALGLRDRIEAVVLTDQWGRAFWKPHPRAFEWIMQAFALAPEACVYVADNAAKDFAAPRRLGWRTVQVVREDGVYAAAPAIEGGAPGHRIETLDELDLLLV